MVPGPPIPRLLVNFFSVFFFQSDRPTQYQETHSTLNEKKGGMSLWEKVVSIENLPKKTNQNEKPRFKSNRTFSSLTLKPSDTSIKYDEEKLDQRTLKSTKSWIKRAK